jgi:hypothetical protein
MPVLNQKLYLGQETLGIARPIYRVILSFQINSVMYTKFHKNKFSLYTYVNANSLRIYSSSASKWLGEVSLW